MVTVTDEERAVNKQEADFCWLFDAPRGSHAAIPDRPGWHWCKGSEQVYEVSSGKVAPPQCECRGFKRWGHCYHIEAVQRPPEEIRCGRCPACGDDLVNFLSFDEGTGYLMEARCWRSWDDPPGCGFRKVL